LHGKKYSLFFHNLNKNQTQRGFTILSVVNFGKIKNGERNARTTRGKTLYQHGAVFSAAAEA
jgi:hypothetical protein